MTNQPYTPPHLHVSAFNCPMCNAFAKQHWETLYIGKDGTIRRADFWNSSTCEHCRGTSFWHQKDLVFPSSTIAPLPNTDLPGDIVADYQEAASILSHSPRGAAALLRLCVQKLCKHLGEDGKNINNDIASLVSKGLSPTIQKSLDIVRVVGNEAVHPGTLDIRDDPETAIALFGLINIIADSMISQPKHIDELYSKLPETKLAEINRRDTKN